MKLARYLEASGATSGWGVLDLAGGTVRPLAGPFAEIAAAVMAGSRPALAGPPIELAGVRLLAPLPAGATIVGTGANYLEHLRRLGHTQRPATTVAYFKPITAIVGPDEEIAYPRITSELDYEVELVAIVGSPELTAVPDGSRHLLGYTVGNDVSARDAVSSIGGPDLFSMKALDRSTPIGPWIVTAEEIGERIADGVTISLRVNAEERQRDSTSELLFSIDELLAYVTDRVTLRTGDLLFTGTPCGVGKEDGRFLEPGDVVEAEVEGIGVLRNVVGARPG